MLPCTLDYKLAYDLIQVLYRHFVVTSSQLLLFDLELSSLQHRDKWEMCYVAIVKQPIHYHKHKYCVVTFKLSGNGEKDKEEGMITDMQ